MDWNKKCFLMKNVVIEEEGLVSCRMVVMVCFLTFSKSYRSTSILLGIIGVLNLTASIADIQSEEDQSDCSVNMPSQFGEV